MPGESKGKFSLEHKVISLLIVAGLGSTGWFIRGLTVEVRSSRTEFVREINNLRGEMTDLRVALEGVKARVEIQAGGEVFQP